jgi:hypothetical protein
MRDPFNTFVENGSSNNILFPYKDLKSITETTPSLKDDDPIVVSIAMGADRHVQFRAFVKDLVQNVTPDYKINQYIGRIEKFVSYTSVQRDISFKLGIIAFSKEELDVVWTRINYLTAMAFPYGFNKGILQPNVVRLTLGKVFQDQPMYLKSLSTNFTDITETWDIDKELPIGATLELSFTIIEKSTKIASSPFYGATELMDNRFSSTIKEIESDTPLEETREITTGTRVPLKSAANPLPPNNLSWKKAPWERDNRDNYVLRSNP